MYLLVDPRRVTRLLGMRPPSPPGKFVQIPASFEKKITKTRMHSSRMHTAHSFIISPYLVISHACPPPHSNHTPPQSNHTCPCGSNHAHPPPLRAIMHPYPQEQPHMPPPEQPCMLPPRANTHAHPPDQPCMPPGATTHAPPEQPCMPPHGQNDRHL